MAYKDKEKQKEAQRDWVRQKRAGQGSTDTPNTTSYTIEDVKALSASQAKAILDSWLTGQGTAYQQHLAVLGQAYG